MQGWFAGTRVWKRVKGRGWFDGSGMAWCRFAAIGQKKRRMGMRNIYGSLVAGLCVAALLSGVSAQAEEVADVKKGEVRFAIGLSYASGIYDVYDFVENEIEARGAELEGFVIPVGITFVGGYRFAFGGEILIDAGPLSILMVDIDAADDTYYNWDVPVGLTGGYAFFADKAVSPYVRGGVRYHFTGGDFADSSTPGLYVAAGVNFFSNKAVQLQLEVAYDASQVTYKVPDDWPPAPTKGTEEIEPGGFMVSIRAAF